MPAVTTLARLLLVTLLALGLARPAAAQERQACDPRSETREVSVRPRPPPVCGDGRVTRRPISCTQTCGWGCGHARRCSPVECRYEEETCDGRDLAGESCISNGYAGGRLRCTDECTFDYSECRMCIPNSGLRCATHPFDAGREVFLFPQDNRVAVVSPNARGDLVGGFLDADLDFAPFEPLATETRSASPWGDYVAFVSREGHLRTVNVFTREVHTIAEGMPAGALTLLPETDGTGIAVAMGFGSDRMKVLLYEHDGTPMSPSRAAHFSAGSNRLFVAPVRKLTRGVLDLGELRPGDRILAVGSAHTSRIHALRGNEMHLLRRANGYSWNGGAITLRWQDNRFVDTYGPEGQPAVEHSAPPPIRPRARGLGESAYLHATTVEAFGGVLVVDPRRVPGTLELALVLRPRRNR